MLKRKDKEAIVKKLNQEIKEAKSVIFTDYKGSEVNEIRKLRKELKSENISYNVFKKTLIRIVLKNLGIENDIKSYKGPIALAVSREDEVAAAKIIAKYA
ncbi:MAG: 50S ribosomal protein L10, partial [Candidatus Moranbacteria bacterium]|nr:50S ribosomal protein L10 [Candidatus Moranbacteria bacterium]